MYWTIETSNGGFEGSKLKEVVNDMIEYYGENEETPSNIEYVIGYTKNDREKIICKNGISRIQNLVDEGVEEWVQGAKEEYQHQQDLRSDYYASVL